MGRAHYVCMWPWCFCLDGLGWAEIADHHEDDSTPLCVISSGGQRRTLGFWEVKGLVSVAY